ncbi:MAG: carbamoyltransferase C-terminal domain-containing protein, partial [Planctomycetota bacterium]|nr:carbamoyltransferase C-terminal domain-containing protein [Planctomycetota bacterium]
AVHTADGLGEWTTAATWRAEAHALTRLRRADYPHSPGKAYAAVTQWLGFVPESDEGKTMGLAAYGDPASPGAAFTRALLQPDAEALLRVDAPKFGFPWGEARLYGEAFLEALGPAGDGAGPDRAGDGDAALGIQQAVETFARDAGQRALAEAGATTLAVAGGLFLTCAMNGALLRAGIDLRPFPVAGDAGAAWGAASEVHRRLTGRPAEALETVFLGHEITAAEAARVGAREGMQHFAEDDALADAIAERIAAGRVVCVARERAEFGPRALGNRSVLASPTSLASRDRVNTLKGREAWRPVAPIIRASDRHWFEDLRPSPYMILTFVADEDARREIPGIVHADGTARVQTVSPLDHLMLCQVLDGLETRGHPAALINTSFNRRGEPIVNTAEQAWTAFDAMGFDSLVVGNWIHDRPTLAPSPRGATEAGA